MANQLYYHRPLHVMFMIPIFIFGFFFAIITLSGYYLIVLNIKSNN